MKQANNHISRRQETIQSLIKPVQFASGRRINARFVRFYETLLRLREKLLAQRGIELSQVLEPGDGHTPDEADGAAAEFDRDLMLGVLSSRQDALYEIEEALHRVLEGTYGICEQTGRPIPVARLRAVPWTRHVREVEEEFERSGEIARPHLGRLGSTRGESGILEQNETGESDPRPEDQTLHEKRDAGLLRTSVHDS